MAILEPGDAVRLRGEPGGGRLLLAVGRAAARAGGPLWPVRHEHQAELVQAFADYQSGRMGEITRTAEVR